MSKPRVWHFWAIETDIGHPDSPHTLLGVGWFEWPRPETPGLDGPRTALFRTRASARAAIKAKGLERYRARAVRVVCTVRRIK